jgi:hypothetical protein
MAAWLRAGLEAPTKDKLPRVQQLHAKVAASQKSAGKQGACGLPKGTAATHVLFMVKAIELPKLRGQVWECCVFSKLACA